MLMDPSLLINFIFLLLPLVFSSSITKSGCPDRCGNLSIPFPFGVGSNCSFGPAFDIICDTSTNPPKAYLTINNTEVNKIELDPPRIRANYPNLALACYHLSGYQPTDLYVNFSATQYTFSDDNWLTTIGCDDMVTGLVFYNKKLEGGCVSYCSDMDDSDGIRSCPEEVISGFSPGNGCCRIPIPKGATSLRASLSDLHAKWKQRSRLFPCSFAFVGEKTTWDSAEFSSYQLRYLHGNSMATLNDTVVPSVRLDWRIGAENCNQAKQNSTTYACQGNSRCVDFDANIGGYNCRCQEGYEGNPYLAPGCHDIDECADPSNPCKFGCVNTLGNFTCPCPKGHFGDGKIDCYRLPLSKMIIVSIGLGSGMGLLLLLSICFWLYKVLENRKNRKRKEKFFKRNGGLLLQQQTNEGTFEKTKLFLAKELEKATDNFNESRVLGQGGQGTVYKGMLSNGKIVAIKKSKLVDEDQLQQFINEVVILSQINHRNVVKLLGCCLETEVPLLVYEFVPNGTLFDLIHDPSSELPISWNMRLKIAADIAGALAYLHSASSLPIYHRDIKSSNILLDETYIVKVSDFGISRSVAVDQTHLTTQVKGTFGYFDPEYFQSSQFTEKSDVYSFGVVLVELLTGQRPISLSRTEEERSLATHFLASVEANNLDLILDAQVSEQGGKEEVIAVAKLAQRCLNLKGKMRPTMKEVAIELESLRISEKSSIFKDESEETRAYEAKPMMISDIQYTWTASGNSVASSSSDTHPLTFATM